MRVKSNGSMIRAGYVPGSAGFTMIELLLVLVILGVLAAIVVPKFAGRSEQAKVTAAKTDIGRLEVALDAFEIDNGRFPTSQEGLRVLFERPSDAQAWRGPYIKRGIPRDPWNNEYIYEYPGRYNENSYDLYSMGPDMRQGSEDDVTNWTVEDRVQR
jgi:general secretion pathway protein G